MRPVLPVPAAKTDAALFAAVELWARARHRRYVRWLRKREQPPGRRFSLALPKCTNDKFLWRKVFDRDPLFTRLCDKLEAKRIVQTRAPEVAIPEVLWVGEDARAIPAELFRADALVKTNHGAGTNILLRDTALSPGEIAARINRHLRKPYGRSTGQWGYRNIPRRVFVERRIDAPGLVELKVYIAGGHVPRVLHIVDRFGRPHGDVWKDDGSGLTLSEEPYLTAEDAPCLPLPASTGAAIDAARQIAGEIDYIRVDFMTDGTRLWFGEVTVYPLGGLLAHGGADPENAHNRYWDLRRSWFMQTPQRGWREAYRRALIRSFKVARSGPVVWGRG
ncbi:ATP-grasp fold amidoligase family protein [Vannielia litorea]|uniref:ATP-grasp fold amidoligase family protein n=1 Tax=Vannielia litorea TaxID=1217970 RepID=UPI001BCBC723